MITENLITPSVMDTTNFKEFFLKYDAIQNITSELVVSLQRKYKCNAGCKMCYLKDTWLSDELLAGQYDTPILTPDVEASILSLFNSFSVITTIDDLFSFKQHRPDLYDFYLRNAHLMSSTAMSDIAFIQQYPMLMNEIKFNSIYEISFSDAFLQKNSGKLVGDLIKKLDTLHQRSPITKLKIIMTLDNDGATVEIKQLTDWANNSDIPTVVHDDITKNRLNATVDILSATVQDNTFFPYDSLPMQVLSEVVHLQYTDLYLTMVDGSSEQDPPFFNIMTDGLDDMAGMLYRMVDSKLRTYRRYVNKMSSGCANKLRDYYVYITSSVIPNQRFNFIPQLLLPSWTNMYATLKRQGFVETIHGLYRPSDLGVVPLFTISTQSKLKLHHIPIKCKKVKELT